MSENPPAAVTEDGLRETTYLEAIRDAMREEMLRDDSVFILGEDVGRYGGAFKITEGFLDEFGPDRVIDTPITEHGFAGLGVGAAFAGQLAVTISSGPGFVLKQEALGLAVMTELPMIVVNVQRAGPSTGLPTKTEQADLLQAVFGRNGECPLVVLAAAAGIAKEPEGEPR